MSSDPNSNPDSQEQEKKPAIPQWMVILLGMAVYAGMMYVNKHGGALDAKVYEPYANFEDVKGHWPQIEMPPGWLEGREQYNIICIGCHQQNGQGLTGQFPPLAGSEWVLTPKSDRLIRIVLNGLQGPITVKDVEYNSLMPPLGSALSDEAIANILTYIRFNKDWDPAQEASGVTVDEVAAVRAEMGSRTAYFTGDELMSISVD